MYRHVVLWKFDEGHTPGQLRENAIKIKAGLEELAYEVHGVASIDVRIDPVRDGGGDGADIMLESCFETRDAFRDYLRHPRHRAVEKLLDGCTRECLHLDFEEENDELI